MKPKIIVEPSEEPITLAEAKARLSINDNIDDADITSHIKAAREQGESHTARSFITQTLELALDRFPSEIELPKGPVQSITSIKYLDSDGVEQTLDSANYMLDDYSERPWALLTAGNSWPDTYDTPLAVKVRYVAGFGLAADVPEDIKNAILIAVGHWVRFQAEAESGFGPTRMPKQFFDLLDRHRIIKF